LSKSSLERLVRRAAVGGAIASAAAQELWSPRSDHPVAAALGWAGPWTRVPAALLALGAAADSDVASLAALASLALLPRDGRRHRVEAFPRSTDFTVLVHNVLATNRHGGRLTRMHEETGHDIALLVEVNDRLAGALERHCRDRHLALVPSRGFQGAGVVSRWPIDSIDEFTSGINTGLVVRTGGLTVVVAHLPAPKVSGRLLVSLERQHRAVSRLCDVVSAIEGPLVVGGDFNATYWNRSLRRVMDAGGLVDAATVSGASRSFTFPARAPVVAIDHCLVRGLRPRWARTATAAGSDHRALLIGLDRGVWGAEPTRPAPTRAPRNATPAAERRAPH